MARKIIVEELSRLGDQIKRVHADAQEPYRELIIALNCVRGAPEKFAQQLGAEFGEDGRSPAERAREALESILSKAAEARRIYHTMADLRGKLGGANE